MEITARVFTEYTKVLAPNEEVLLNLSGDVALVMYSLKVFEGGSYDVKTANESLNYVKEATSLSDMLWTDSASGSADIMDNMLTSPNFFYLKNTGTGNIRLALRGNRA